jgi:hypothetical protein
VRKYLEKVHRRWSGSALLALMVLCVAGVLVYGANGGSPAESVRLLSGSVWLPSSRVGQLTLLDGSTAEVVAQVQVAAAGSPLDVVQLGPNAYSVDRATGTVRRVGGATFAMTAPASPIPDTTAELTAFAAPDALYTVDMRRGVLATVDPGNLGRRGELFSLGVTLGAGAAEIDDAGRLWIADDATGDLIRVEGGTRTIHRGLVPRGRNILTLVDGQPVVVNTDSHKAVVVDPATGDVSSAFDMNVDRDETTQLSGSPHGKRIYVVARRGVLTICDLVAANCDAAVPLSNGGFLGAALEAGNRLFIPDYTAGRVWIVDLASRSVTSTQVLVPPGQFQLLTRDGLVFFNDPGSERAGVIRFDGTVVRTAKYDPNDPSKGLTQPPTETSSDQPTPDQIPSSSAQSTTSSQPPTRTATNAPRSPTSTQGRNPAPASDRSSQSAGAPTTAPTTQPPISTSGPPTNSPAPSFSTTGPQPSTTPPPPAPRLRITMSNTQPVVGEDVTLNVRTTTGMVVTAALWNFGDGQTANGGTTSHQWSAARAYLITVQATLADGQRMTTSVTITVSSG